jgi:hypothetical protein
VTIDNEEVLIQNISGGRSWGKGYLTHQNSLPRVQGTRFSGRIKADGQAGEFMIGWKDNSTLYRYNELVHGIYFTTGNQIYIYEDAANRGVVGTYVNDQWYDFEIVLKSTGA